jgi:Protein of unknown function (DUF2384)
MTTSGAKAAMPVKLAENELLPGEHADIRVDVRELLSNADEWLSSPNTAFAGKAPGELIGTNEEYRLRNMLRSVLYSSMA